MSTISKHENIKRFLKDKRQINRLSLKNIASNQNSDNKDYLDKVKIKTLLTLDNKLDCTSSKIYSNSSDFDIFEESSSITINNLKLDKMNFCTFNYKVEDHTKEVEIDNINRLNLHDQEVPLYNNTDFASKLINYKKIIITLSKFLAICILIISSIFLSYNFYYFADYINTAFKSSLNYFKNSKILNLYIGNSIPLINYENTETNQIETFDDMMSNYYRKEQINEIKRLENVLYQYKLDNSYSNYSINNISSSTTPYQINSNRRFLLDNIYPMESEKEKMLIETMNNLKKSYIISLLENDLIGSNFIGKWNTETIEFVNIISYLIKKNGINSNKLNKILKNNPLLNFKNFKRLRHFFKKDVKFDLNDNSNLEQGKIKIIFQKHNNILKGNNFNDIDLTNTLEAIIYIFDGEFYDIWVKLIGKCTMPLTFKGYLNSQELHNSLQFKKTNESCFETSIENNEIKFAINFKGEIQNGKDFNASKKKGKIILIETLTLK